MPTNFYINICSYFNQTGFFLDMPAPDFMMQTIVTLNIDKERPMAATRITGIGSALVDVLINEEDAFLQALGKQKGGMTLVEAGDIQALLSKSTQTPVVVPGGAACNTIVGVACLGGDARFIGRRGDDTFGNDFQSQITACGVEPRLSVSPLPPAPFSPWSPPMPSAPCLPTWGHRRKWTRTR